MRYQLPDPITEDYVKEFMSTVINPIVNGIRKDLAIRFNVHKGENVNYTGLCDVASELFVKQMEYHVGTFIKPGAVKVEIHHGEQRHCPRISSWYWGAQHTWNVVLLGQYKIYVDCTSSQFAKYYQKIPQYYISTIPPKWYIDDRNNKALDRSEWKINKIIKVPVFGEKRVSWVGIMDILTYYVWGAISDLIGSIFGLRKILLEDDE